MKKIKDYTDVEVGDMAFENPDAGGEFNMKLKLKQIVYHKKLYWGKEPMKVVGIRENEVELEGDYSGGTHAVCQKNWLPLKGVLLAESEKSYSEILS